MSDSKETNAESYNQVLQTYEAQIDGGEGGDEEFRAESAEKALEMALEWARDGDWPNEDRPLEITVRVENIEDEDDCAEESFFVGEPAEAEPDLPADCPDEKHDWRRPWELVGGLEDNPGCWSYNGDGMEWLYVSASSGHYLVERCDHCTDSAYAAEYRDPDDKSLRWLAELWDWEPGDWLSEYFATLGFTPP